MEQTKPARPTMVHVIAHQHAGACWYSQLELVELWVDCGDSLGDGRVAGLGGVLGSVGLRQPRCLVDAQRLLPQMRALRTATASSRSKARWAWGQGIGWSGRTGTTAVGPEAAETVWG